MDGHIVCAIDRFVDKVIAVCIRDDQNASFDGSHCDWRVIEIGLYSEILECCESVSCGESRDEGMATVIYLARWPSEARGLRTVRKLSQQDQLCVSRYRSSNEDVVGPPIIRSEVSVTRTPVSQWT